MIPKHVPRQRDFSAGELVESAKRSEDIDIGRAGSRQALNFRLIGTRKLENRPGRSILFADDGRVDEVRMSATATYRLISGSGVLKIRDAAGAIVAGAGGFPWSIATVDQIVWTQAGNDIVICFPGMRTKIARWDGGSGFTVLDYAFGNYSSGISKRPFYRISKKGITITVSAKTGAITVTASEPVFTDKWVGQRLTWIGYQLLITGFTSTTQVSATVTAILPKTMQYNSPTWSGGSAVATFFIGDIISSATGKKAEVAGHTGPEIVVNHLKAGESWAAADGIITGPNGNAAAISGSTNVSTGTSLIWENEAIGDLWGWPRSCFFDQNRLGFCDLPGLPEGIVWSGIGLFDDFEVGASANQAIFEVAPQKARVHHVVGGADEFVLTDKGIWYIPISETNPLRPGSVAFREISAPASSSVKPVSTPQGVAFVPATRKQVSAIVGTGQTAQPWVTRDASDFNSHLFTNIKALTVAKDGPFPEAYIFALNTDGSTAVGKFEATKTWIGWVPWRAASGGIHDWISALGSNVLSTVRYTFGASSLSLVEKLDVAAYLDAQAPLNALPAPLAVGTDADVQEFPAIGIKLGTLTASGGLAAAYDGTTGKAAAACASRAAVAGFYGYQLDQALPIKKVELWPSNNNGFTQGEAGNITLTLRASNVAPNSEGNNGTILGTATIADTTVGPVTINSNDPVTPYLYRWAYITNAAATNIHLAQARFYMPGVDRHAPNGGSGALWFYAGATVDILDGLKYLGTRVIDASGNLTLEAGDELGAASIVAGLGWTATWEPFIPHVEAGQSVRQTMRRRKVKQAVIAFQNSNGFVFANRRVPAYRQGDDQALAPLLREGVESFRPRGRTHDPRLVLMKDTPGPLRIVEFAADVTA